MLTGKKKVKLRNMKYGFGGGNMAAIFVCFCCDVLFVVVRIANIIFLQQQRVVKFF